MLGGCSNQGEQRKQDAELVRIWNDFARMSDQHGHRLKATPRDLEKVERVRLLIREGDRHKRELESLIPRLRAAQLSDTGQKLRDEMILFVREEIRATERSTGIFINTTGKLTREERAQLRKESDEEWSEGYRRLTEMARRLGAHFGYQPPSAPPRSQRARS